MCDYFLGDNISEEITSANRFCKLNYYMSGNVNKTHTKVIKCDK